MLGEHRNNERLERSDVSNECVFCRIAARRINAYVVHEDRLVAVLDRGPIRTGHIQIAPRDHFRCFDEAPAEIVCAIVLLEQRIALALKKLYGAPRVAFLLPAATFHISTRMSFRCMKRPTSPHVVISRKTA